MGNFAADIELRFIQKEMKRIFITLSAVLVVLLSCRAQHTVLTLDSCRALALSNNKELRMADENVRAAYYERKAAFTKYFPRVNAMGTYMYTSKEFSLLSDEQKESLNHLGTAVSAMAPQLESMAGTFDGIGQGLVDALHTDTRNMGAVAVMLTQPLYMGGQIRAYNNITKYAEEIAQNKRDLSSQEVIVEVDEAYWRIVSLQAKKELAESFLALTEKLNSDVVQLKSEGFATTADELSVRVKVNEARTALIQVNNGLKISQMLLCQICGLDMNTPITIADNKESVCQSADSLPQQPATNDAVAQAWRQRLELRSLEKAEDIANEKVRLTRAGYLPNLALTGGYMASNPSVFNSFERQMKGMWNVGVVLNIPIVTSGERLFKLKSAKAHATAASLQLEETREKVQLQVNQCKQKLEEAAERMQTAERSSEEADENLRYADLGMKEGVIPVSNVLEAQTAWLAAHCEKVSANVDMRLAKLYLDKAIGVIKY